MNHSPILVIGSIGKTGRSNRPTVLGARLGGQGGLAAVFDWEKPSTTRFRSVKDNQAVK
jgi:hypothetical protein